MADNTAGRALTRTGVTLRLTLYPWTLILFLARLTVTVDNGLPQRFAWGREFIPLNAGRHRIGVTVQLLGGIRTHVSYDVDISDRDQVLLRWRAPMFWGFRGSWRETRSPLT